MLFKPHGYQQIAINNILDNPISGLILDMGLGKTISTLMALDTLLLTGDAEKVLIIAPKRVAEATWTDEIDKWDDINHLTTSKIMGNKKQRQAALRKKADIYIISRDNVVWLVDELYKEWPFDTVVIDELSSFKSNKSQRFKALRKVRPYFRRIIGLTGTPTPNGLMDLWAQIYLLDGGKRLGRTITSYRQQYFYPAVANGHIVYKYGVKDNAEEEIYQKIDDICISMKAVDYLDMPERIDNKIMLELDPKDKVKYRSLEKDLVLGEEVTAINAAVLCNKLLQIANGAIYTDETKEVIEIHQEKLKALEEIIETAQGKPILCFYNFKHDYDRICNYFKKLKIRKLETSKDIKDWNEGKIDMALVHPASAGHGLNLQYGSNIIVWFGLTWSLELYQQANARLYRQGQKETVIIHHLIVKGTVDEDVMNALEGKDINQEKLLNAIKVRCE